MDEQLIRIWTEGEIVEIFPFEDDGLEPGHFEAIVVHDDVVYHVLLDSNQQPLKINHIVTEADYDLPEEEGEWDDWDRTLYDGLEDNPWEEEE
jgi:hypothetical protein